MGGQIENAEIFAMCNCVTLHMPRVYSAHGMTMEMFLQDVEPGKRIPRKHLDLWPVHFVKIFKIPKDVKVFLFSVFNEVYLPSHVWKEDRSEIRFTLGFHKAEYDPIRRLSVEVPRLEVDKFSEELIRVGEKVNRIWPEAKKVLLRYDKSRATDEVRDTFLRYEKAVEEAVDWPIVEVHDDKGPPYKKGEPHLWCHYRKQALNQLYQDIVAVEANYQKRELGNG